MKKLILLLGVVLLGLTSFAGGPPPPPDDCSTVGDLVTLGSPISESTTGMANDFSFCTMGSAADQIYYIDVPVGSTLTIGQPSNLYDSRHSLRYGGACPGTTEIVCTDDPDTQIESWQNCTGSLQRVYWIQSGYSTGEGDYDLQWNLTAGVCGACSDQTIAALPFSQAGMNTAGFGDDYSSLDACASSYMNGDDYVFDYTPAVNECIDITLTNTATWVGIFVTDGCPDVGSCVASNTNSAGNPSLSNVNLVGGTTYYFTVSTYPSPQTTPFDINITNCGPPGSCTDQTIASLPFSQNNMNTAGFGDDYSSLDACASSYMNGDDYIFDYTPAANETVNITLTNTGTWVGVFVTDGCPDVGACIASNTNSSGNPSIGCVNLTAGQQYFFTVSTFPSPQTTAFDIDVQVVGLSPPANDECASAVALTINADLLCGTTTASTLTDATNSGIAGCVGTADDDVWFSFTATSTVHNFDLLNIVGTTTDLVHEIFSGNCGSLSSIACSDPNASQWSGFTIGQTYYVRVYSNTATSCQTVDFDFCVGTPPPPPSNDEPCGAITLNVNNGSCAYQSGVLQTSATVSTGMPAPGCGSLGPDIWYKFTVPASGRVIIDMATSGGPTDMDMAWYTGPNCGNLNTLIECDDADSQNGSMAMICHAGSSCVVPGDCQQNATLTPGDVVYVRLWEYGGTPFGPFDICAYDPGPPGAASTCASATVIASLPYSNAGQTTCCRGNTYDMTDGCLSSYQDGEDFMYEYTPAANEVVDITLTGTLSYTGLFVTDKCPSSGGVNCIGSATSTTGNPTLCGVSLDGGTTYYIMVDTDPTPNCTPFNINMTSSSTPTCGLNYSFSNIGFSPDLNNGTNIALPIDDRFSSSYVPIGFNFCFDGFEFTQCLVSSNGYVIFDPIGCASNLPSANAAPGDYSAYSINAAIPNTTDAPRNAIMFPWQDIDPSLGGTIKYQVLGVAPNRRFVLTFANIPYYSCTSLEFSGQLKLFETTNDIEIHIANKENCSTWNGGANILGLHNYNGTVAVLGVNYPTTNSYSNQARLISNNCVGPCIVLPVKLLDFSGTPFEDYNLIEWSTLTELNNDYFILERSSDGISFEKVDIIKGNGNSSEQISYSYQHSYPHELEYYRLKQVDFDGRYEYSNIIAVRQKTDINVSIYPNPAKNDLFIGLSESTEGIYTIVYTNVLGSVSKEQIEISEGTTTYQVKEFINLSSGIYFVQILDENNEVIKTQKIVKE
jgi:hypothetical protein